MMKSSVLRYLYHRRQLIFYTISFLGAFACLLPVILLYSDIYSGYETDSTFRGNSYSTSSGSPSLNISLFLVVIPLIDTLIDFYQSIWHWFEEKKKKKNDTDEVICRLTDKERFMFIIGIILQGIVCYLPSSHIDVASMKTIMVSTNTASIIFLLSPVLQYLNRSTTTFNSLVTFSILISFVIGSVCFSLKHIFLYDQTIYYRMLQCQEVTFILGGVFFFVTVVVCFILYCIEKHVTRSNRNSSNESSTKFNDKKKKSDDDLMYTHYIPALHMIAGLIVISAEFLRSKLIIDRVFTGEVCNYIVLIGEVMVLVIELRIRKNEIARGLAALLDSKIVYVRYISHELRTPLNTAYLGLKLLTKEFKASTNIEDMKKYDTLHDVSRSCEAAIDILNDLLCYEKLESGILELHKEEITVLPYLSDCLSMFAVQAKECGVTVSIDTAVTDSHHKADISGQFQVTLPLQSNDTVFADKFKINQVIRNLISNALKFTPIGGDVVMQASFVRDIEGTVEGYDVEGGGVGQSSRPPIRHVWDWYHGYSSKVHALGVGRTMNKKNQISKVQKIDEEEVDTVNAIAGKLVIVVTDTGAGISANNQKRLFNEIIQFNPEKLQAGGGSGLGLWITSNIVNMHDGQISVASGGEGQGCSFTVKIPMIRYPSRPPRHTPSPFLERLRSLSKRFSMKDVFPSGTELRAPIPVDYSPMEIPRSSVITRASVTPPTPSMMHTFHVLVVDDSNLNRKMLIKCLQAADHVCEFAGDGNQAIERVKERMHWNNDSKSSIDEGQESGRPYDVILMDFVMPLKDGPTATAELRAMGYTGAIFGVTGNGLSSDVEYFLRAGANEVLLKPLNIEDFHTAMSER